MRTGCCQHVTPLTMETKLVFTSISTENLMPVLILVISFIFFPSNIFKESSSNYFLRPFLQFSLVRVARRYHQHWIFAVTINYVLFRLLLWKWFQERLFFKLKNKRLLHIITSSCTLYVHSILV